MSKDYARAVPRGRTAKPPANGRSGKWPFLGGLTLGLGVALLVFLVDHDHLDLDRLFGESDAARGGAESAAPQAAPRPRFDFYTILPEMEVVIPERDSPAPDYPARAPSTPTTQPARAPAAAPPAVGGGYILQAGSFRSAGDADALKATLALSGFEATVQRVSINRDTYHRVRLGPFASQADAERARERLAGAGVQSLLLRLKG